MRPIALTGLLLLPVPVAAADPSKSAAAVGELRAAGLSNAEVNKRLRARDNEVHQELSDFLHSRGL